MLTLQEA
jgi:hypothetical protein